MSEKSGGLFYRGIVYLDRLLRHRGVLGQHRWLRDLLRKPYHKLINLHGQGIPINIGGVIPVRLPPEFSSICTESYEVEAMTAVNDWLQSAGDASIVIDVGCSIGYVTCACLFANTGTQVVAIDSDLHSLQSMLRVCRYAPEADKTSRLLPLWGLISSRETPELDLTVESANTRKALRDSGVSGDPYTLNYITLKRHADSAIPQYSLSSISDSLPGEDHRILVKIDVEGAEMEVLLGAARLLKRANVEWSVSVHPQYLPDYNRTAEELHEYMEQFGYVGEKIAEDHEEHWWFRPRTAV